MLPWRQWWDSNLRPWREHEHFYNKQVKFKLCLCGGLVWVDDSTTQRKFAQTVPFKDVSVKDNGLVYKLWHMKGPQAAPKVIHSDRLKPHCSEETGLMWHCANVQGTVSSLHFWPKSCKPSSRDKAFCSVVKETNGTVCHTNSKWNTAAPKWWVYCQEGSIAPSHSAFKIWFKMRN